MPIIVAISFATALSTDLVNTIPDIVLYIGLVFVLGIVLWRAPVTHKNHPLSNKQKKKMRTIAIIWAAFECLVTALLVFINCNYAGAVFNACFITAILALVRF